MADPQERPRNERQEALALANFRQSVIAAFVSLETEIAALQLAMKERGDLDDDRLRRFRETAAESVPELRERYAKQITLL